MKGVHFTRTFHFRNAIIHFSLRALQKSYELHERQKKKKRLSVKNSKKKGWQLVTNFTLLF